MSGIAGVEALDAAWLGSAACAENKAGATIMKTHRRTLMFGTWAAVLMLVNDVPALSLWLPGIFR